MENTFVVAMVNGDTLEVLRRDDSTVIVFGCKETADRIADELGGDYSVYKWY